MNRNKTKLWDRTPIDEDHFGIQGDRPLTLFDRKSIRTAENICAHAPPSYSLVIAKRGRSVWEALGLEDPALAFEGFSIAFPKKYWIRRREPDGLTAVVNFWPAWTELDALMGAGVEVLLVIDAMENVEEGRTQQVTTDFWLGNFRTATNKGGRTLVLPKVSLIRVKQYKEGVGEKFKVCK